MLQVVAVEKHKRPSGGGSWGAYRIGVDAYGDWLYTPAHSLFRSHGPDGVGSCEVAQDGPGGPGRDSVVLMPRDQWWVATWVHGASTVCSADISTPPSFERGSWHFDDLELDPYLGLAGYGVEDEDEFDQSCSAGLISDDERTAAIAAEGQLRAAFVPGSDLLRAGANWLRQGRDARLDPLAMSSEGSRQEGSRQEGQGGSRHEGSGRRSELTGQHPVQRSVRG